MRVARLVSWAALVAAAGGCASSLRGTTARSIGCDPDQLEVFNVQQVPYVRTWSATCGGRRYVCSQQIEVVDLKVGRGLSNESRCVLEQPPETPSGPRPGDGLLADARAALDDGKYAEALVLAGRALEEKAPIQEARQVITVAHCGLGDAARAGGELRLLVGKFRDDARESCQRHGIKLR